MTTKQIIFDMLTENTGRHPLDSGGAYGRHWERNQELTIEDFENEPEESYTYNKDSNYLERRVSVFHFLSQLDTDWICEEFNNMPCKDWDSDGEVYGVSDAQWRWLTSKCEVEIGHTFNTYNGDSDLSQVLQGSWLKLNGDVYLLLQIHGGCDVRGGYTNAKLFTTPDEYMIHEYLHEYKDSHETLDDLIEGHITAVDSEDPTITYTSEEIRQMITESIASDTK